MPRFLAKGRHQFILLLLGKIMKRQVAQSLFISPNWPTSENGWHVLHEEGQRT
jgi:hypothetical protein